MSPANLMHVAASAGLASRAQVDPYAWYNIAGEVGAAGWLVVYAIAVYHGIKTKTCAIPAYAICLNLGWEILASFFVSTPITAWLWINRAWLGLDLGIAYTLIRYGRTRPMGPSLSRHFLPILGCAFAIGLVGQLTYIRSYEDALGFEVAFLIDFVMAVLFVLDQLDAPRRDNATLAIAWGRLVGDLGVCIQSYWLLPLIDRTPSFVFHHFLFVMIVALDCIYIGLVWRARRPGPPMQQPTQRSSTLATA
jgi:hypothetical protein